MQNDRATRVVARWIYIGIAMLIVQVLLGGITRLTGSGLSITEWQPIMGTLPPMNEAGWQAAFSEYQKIAQYKYLNQHFTLTDFKFIFFWEWFHRLWARLIGIAFLLPFIYFLIKGYFKKWMIVPLIILFVLGALQGFVGWIMVQSGLNENDLYVSHIRLAAHFMAAMVLIAYALVFAIKLTAKRTSLVYNRSLFAGVIGVLILLVIQLTYGAFMAGLKAGTAAATWPDINGMYFPSNLFSNGISDLFHNKITIHFIHRNLAYLLAIIIFIYWLKARKVRLSILFNRYNNAAIILVLLQILLGIITVISANTITAGAFTKFEWMALLHQLTGMLLLLNFVALAYISSRPKQHL